MLSMASWGHWISCGSENVTSNWSATCTFTQNFLLFCFSCVEQEAKIRRKNLEKWQNGLSPRFSLVFGFYLMNRTSSKKPFSDSKTTQIFDWKRRFSYKKKSTFWFLWDFFELKAQWGHGFPSSKKFEKIQGNLSYTNKKS